MNYKFKSEEGYIYKVLDERVCEMTREEAVAKILKANAVGQITGEKFLNGLEALGLIKFEEVVKPKFVSIPHAGGLGRDRVTVSVDDMIEALNRLDYQIIKKG